jgi:hypothetical protein
MQQDATLKGKKQQKQVLKQLTKAICGQWTKKMSCRGGSQT